MFRRSLKIAITVCLFTGAIVLGVHLMHKGALADNVNVKVYLYDGEGDPVPLLPVYVRFHFQWGYTDPLLMMDHLDGNYVRNYDWGQEQAPIGWEVTLPTTITPIVPDFSPHEVALPAVYLPWEIEE